MLDNNGLNGEIPSELGYLAQLEELNLEGNRLTGPIPPELGNFFNLEYMDLNDNLLTGPIRPELGELSELAVLYLSTNMLSGQIPSELGNIPGLRGLYLSENMLSGCIPAVLRHVEYHDLTGLELKYCDVLLGDVGIVPGGLHQDFDPYVTHYTAVSDAARVTVTAIREHGTTISYLDNLSRTLPDAVLEMDGHPGGPRSRCDVRQAEGGVRGHGDCSHLHLAGGEWLTVQTVRRQRQQVNRTGRG